MPPSPALPRQVRPHSILEPIHGLTLLTDFEFAVVNHRLFARLRRIKQNGLLYLVFPSATHTRFEHSIGVMHVADGLLEQLWQNSIVSAKKQTLLPLESEDSGVAINFSEIPSELGEWVVQVARLAALVHDLGHGPLSHTFDSFAPLRTDVARFLDNSVIPSLKGVSNELANWGKEGEPGSVGYERVPHEVMSCVFFGKIVSDLASKYHVDDSISTDVAAALLCTPELLARIPEKKRAWIPLIHDIVASAPADADRMDYMERDSRAVGVTYGLFDRNRVLKSMLCYRDPETGAFRLGVKRSGIAAVENLLQARFELFVQVYYHKTNTAISLMLNQIAELAFKAGFRLFQLGGKGVRADFDEMLHEYQELSDDRFLRILRGLDSSDDYAPPETVITLANDLENRNLWKRIFEGSETVAKTVTKTMKDGEADEAIRDGIFHDVRRPEATKDLATGAKLLDKRENGTYAASNREWSDISTIIGALQKAEGDIGRVYAKGEALKHVGRLKTQARTLSAKLETSS